MEFIFIDYSDIYYKKITKTVIPWQRQGKFVQIRHENNEYLIFSPKKFSSSHADIVERFCISMKIDGFYNKKQYKYEIRNPVWTVVGGGKWIINEKDRMLHLFDDSGVYGKFDVTALKERILKLGKMSNYKVQID